MSKTFFRFALSMVVGSTLFIGTLGFAHAGHDKLPGAVDAPHGGTIKKTSELYMELVNDASGIKIYPLTHELTPVSLSELKITGTAQAPKKKKEPVKLSEADDHFEAKVDVKGAYRYTLDLSMTFKGKTEKVSFQIEPQG